MAHHPAEHPKILVLGLGGIGGIVAAHLLEMGQRVFPVTRNAEVVEAIRTRGFRLVGEGGARTIAGPAFTDIPAEEGPFDFVVLATQPTDVEAAAIRAAPHMARTGRVVCLQNGLVEARVRPLFPAEVAIAGGVVMWGGSMVEPGVFDRTSSGGFLLGRYDGQADPGLDGLATALESIGPVQRTDNLAGARWSKLAFNCAISSLGTVAGTRLGALVRRRYARRLAIEVMSEVVAVARQESIRLEKLAGLIDLEWLALTETERRQTGSVGLTAKHALMMAVGLRYRRMRSSMLSALERGRTPPVDYLNGEIVSRGERYGIPTPVNRAVQAAVWSVARGEMKQGLDSVRAIYEGTR